MEPTPLRPAVHDTEERVWAEPGKTWGWVTAHLAIECCLSSLQGKKRSVWLLCGSVCAGSVRSFNALVLKQNKSACVSLALILHVWCLAHLRRGYVTWCSNLVSVRPLHSILALHRGFRCVMPHNMPHRGECGLGDAAKRSVRQRNKLP